MPITVENKKGGEIEPPAEPLTAAEIFFKQNFQFTTNLVFLLVEKGILTHEDFYNLMSKNISHTKEVASKLNMPAVDELMNKLKI